MEDKFTEALSLLRMTFTSEGRAVVRTPQELVGKGPCPHCLHEIWPSMHTFMVNDVARPGHPLANAPAGLGGLIVCGRCAKPVIFTEPGKYRGITREQQRALPRVTQRFIKSEQEMIARIKRAVN